MIDPITLIATARATIAGVKQAIALGKDASELFHQFFDAKDAVMKEKAHPTKNPFQSVNSQAMQFIQLAEEMQHIEEEIKNSFMRRGKTNLWMDFLRERNRIVAQNKADELAADKAKAKRKKEIGETIELALLVAVVALIVALGFWGTSEYVDFMKRH
jgi:hypothetical protein